MVTRFIQMGFKAQTNGMIQKLIKENRLVFISDSKVKYTDKQGKVKEYNFVDFGKFVVSTLAVKVDDDKNIQKLSKENGLNSLAVMSSTGISEKQVIEVLNEQYKRSHKK